MQTNPSRTDLADLGTAIDRFGLEAYESEVAAIARLAMKLGSAGVLASILADRSAAPVARLRALAKISANWSCHTIDTPEDHLLAA